MEASIEILMGKILELAVKETIETIMDSKCCLRSKAKWRKVLKTFSKRKEQRQEKVAEAMEQARAETDSLTSSGSSRSEIFNYANRVMSSLRIAHI